MNHKCSSFFERSFCDRGACSSISCDQLGTVEFVANREINIASSVVLLTSYVR